MSDKKKTLFHCKEESTNGSIFIFLYNGIGDSYGIYSIGDWFVIGVIEGTTTFAGDTKFLRVVWKFLNR